MIIQKNKLRAYEIEAIIGKERQLVTVGATSKDQAIEIMCARYGVFDKNITECIELRCPTI